MHKLCMLLILAFMAVACGCLQSVDMICGDIIY